MNRVFKRDSIAANIAIVNAGDKSFIIVLKSTASSLGIGILFEISPKQLPIVSTGILNNITSAVVTIRAISEPGIFLFILGHTKEITIVIKPIKSA